MSDDRTASIVQGLAPQHRPRPVLINGRVYDLVLITAWTRRNEYVRKVYYGEILLTRSLKTIDHGTTAGYRAHQNRNESPCELCREAKRKSDRERQAKYRAKREAEDRRYAEELQRQDYAVSEQLVRLYGKDPRRT